MTATAQIYLLEGRMRKVREGNVREVPLLFTFHWPDVCPMATPSWKEGWEMRSYSWVAMCPAKTWTFVTKEVK